MTYLEYSVQRVPTGISKVLYLNWPLILLPIAVALVVLGVAARFDAPAPQDDGATNGVADGAES